MQDSGADGTAPAFDSTSELLFLFSPCLNGLVEFLPVPCV